MNSVLTPSFLANIKEAWPIGFTEAPTILLVDDETNILSAINRFLKPKGYRILMANDAIKALEVLEAEEVDLIISDMRMPGMNGAQLLNKVRENWPWVVRILLTGYSDVASAITAINEGEIYRYIAKPWDDHEMLMNIRRALERRGLEKEYLRLQNLTQEQNAELLELNQSLELKVQKHSDQLNIMQDKINSDFLNSLILISHFIDCYINALPGHSQRVAAWGKQIASHMQLSNHIQQNIIFASLIHNIAKIGLDTHLAHTSVQEMSSEQKIQFEKNWIATATLILPFEALHEANEIIRHQYEHYDGTGFPNHLSSTDIPIEASILTVTKQYEEALTGLYLPQKMSSDEAQSWIAERKGSHYAPDVVDAFLNIISHKGDNIQKLS
ncbi:MAG: HD domain-containing phosphohydrolase [Pseudomonadota bacterium]